MRILLAVVAALVIVGAVSPATLEDAARSAGSATAGFVSSVTHAIRKDQP